MISCSTLYRCSCSNNGPCSFAGQSDYINPALKYRNAWIVYDGPAPSHHSGNYPNAYGSSYATNDPNSPIPPNSYNGKPCQIRWNSVFPGFPFTDCLGVFDGAWDSSERGCSDCDWSTHTDKNIHFAYSEYYRNTCESACGADSRCDEKEPMYSRGNCPSGYYCGSTCQCAPGEPLRKGGGSACPILKVHNDNKLVTIGKLNIHSPKNQDTIATSTFTMQPINSKYEIIIDEAAYLFWDGSHINSVQLVDESGKECKLISATHSKDGDILAAITNSDDVRVRSYPGDRIKLVYDGCSGNEFSFSVEGYNRKCAICEPMGISNIINFFKGIFGLK